MNSGTWLGPVDPFGALARCRLAFAGVAMLSAAVNVLMLTGSIFMLEVYDRVLPSRSVPTLIGLVVVACMLYLFLGFFDLVRNRILSRICDAFDAAMSGRVYDIVLARPLRQGGEADPQQPIRDVDQVRSFLAGNGPAALFDLPWLPFYLAICFAFHFWIGITAVAGSILLITLTLAAEFGTRRHVRQAIEQATSRTALADGGRRNAEVVRAMGMADRLVARWSEANRRYLASQRRAADVAGGLGACSRIVRMMLQSGVLAVGAFLVIHQEATAGLIIASSILVARAVAPMEMVIANWKSFVAARQSLRRLRILCDQHPLEPGRMRLPAPTASLNVSGLFVVPPGGQRAVIQDVEFRVTAGSALGVVGPSASGKSSLARALVGVWAPARGKIRLDGVDLAQWPPQRLGRHVGYLPQDVELFAGTVAENIARFDPDATPDAIIAAADAADVHDMIVALPEGYDTQIGEGGVTLSGGQRQRIGLARALYGDPFLVVLDEPSSNLDADGEHALTKAILAIRMRNGIAVIVAHRPSALAAVDMVLALKQGKVAAFGPRDQVVRPAVPEAPLIRRPEPIIQELVN
jgi:PrtD family type I secretion system ABC transporter